MRSLPGRLLGFFLGAAPGSTHLYAKSIRGCLLEGSQFELSVDLPFRGAIGDSRRSRFASDGPDWIEGAIRAMCVSTRMGDGQHAHDIAY